MADLYYIEEGYYDIGYFVYTANAASAINSEFTQTTAVTKNVQVSSTISSETTIFAAISHIEGADLFAFTNASISAQADRIRDNASQQTSSFVQTTQDERVRYNSSTISTEITVSSFIDKIKLALADLLDSVSVSCDATRIQSVSIEGNADLTTDGTVSAQAHKIAEGVVTLQSEFQQSASIVHIEGADLFAFTEAAIAVQVDRIRETNIDATSVFDIAVDYIRYRDSDADADSILSAIVDGLRSRDVNLTTQAAFSFAIQEELYKDFSASLTNNFTQSSQADYLRNSGSNIFVEFNQSLQEQRIRNFDSSQNNNFSLGCGFIVVRDAHLTGFNSITLSAVINYTITRRANLEAYFNSYAVVPKYKFTRPRTLQTYSFDRGTTFPTTPVFGSAFAYGGTNGSGSMVTTQSTDWTVAANQNFVFEMYHSSPDVAFSEQPAFAAYGAGTDLRTANLNQSTTSWMLGKTGDVGNTGRLQLAYYDGSAWQRIITTFNLGTGTWRHIVFRRINGNTLQLLVNGVLQGSATFSGALHQPSINNRYIRVRNYLGGSGERSLLDEWTFRKGGDGSITYPNRPQNYEGTLFYYRFDDNWLSGATPPEDYLGLDVIAAAALTSTSSLTFRSFTTQGGKANISSQSTVNAIIGKVNEINLVAFTNGNLTAAVGKITPASADINAAVSQSTLSGRVRFNQSEISSQATVNATISHIKSFSSDSSFNFTVSASEDRIRDSGAQTQAEFSLLARIGKQQAIDLLAFTNGSLTVDANAIKAYQSNLTAVSAVSTVIDRFRSYDSVQNSSFSSTLINDRIRSVVSDFTSISIELVANNYVKGTVINLTGRADTKKPYSEDEYVDDDYATNFDIIVNYIVDNQQTISSSFAVLANITIATEGAALVASSGTMSVNAVKTVRTTSNNISNSNTNIVVAKTPLFVSNISSEFVISVNAGTSEDIFVNLFNNAAVICSIDGTLQASSSLQSQFTQNTNTADSLNIRGSATISTAASLTTAGNRIRFGNANFTALAFKLSDGDVQARTNVNCLVTSSVNVSVKVIKTTSSAMTSSTNLSAVARRTRLGVVTITSAMTFVSAVRDLRLDEIEYKIPAEGWEYKIIGENREYDIIGETRLRSITGESRIRRIDGETRIYIVEK